MTDNVRKKERERERERGDCERQFEICRQDQSRSSEYNSAACSERLRLASSSSGSKEVLEDLATSHDANRVSDERQTSPDRSCEKSEEARCGVRLASAASFRRTSLINIA